MKRSHAKTLVLFGIVFFWSFAASAEIPAQLPVGLFPRDVVMTVPRLAGHFIFYLALSPDCKTLTQGDMSPLNHAHSLS